MVHMVEGLLEKHPEVIVRQRVEDPLSLPPPLYQPEVPQDAQLMARRRGAHPHGLRQLPRRKLAYLQQGEKRPYASRVGQSPHESRDSLVYALYTTPAEHVPWLEQPSIRWRVLEVRHVAIVRNAGVSYKDLKTSSI